MQFYWCSLIFLLILTKHRVFNDVYKMKQYLLVMRWSNLKKNVSKKNFQRTCQLALLWTFLDPFLHKTTVFNQHKLIQSHFFSHLFSHLSHFSQQVNSLSGSKQKKYRWPKHSGQPGISLYVRNFGKRLYNY